jgi:hypothetical protein
MKNVLGTAVTQPREVVTEIPEISQADDVESHVAEKPAPTAQGGVQKAEAVTLLWTKTSLIIAYCL